MIAVGGQVLVVIFARELAWEYPEFANLAVPYSLAAILTILCGQAALAIIIRLLGLVRRGTIFTAPTSRLVNGIIWCLGIATAITAGVAVSGPPGPLFPVYAAVLVAVGIAATLLMLVMRDLLSSAIEYRGELDGVI